MPITVILAQALFLWYNILMNKDVIYIEPEQDITDIISNIKAAKNKIVALVPPKKAGVLRSAVNFKLIAKAARQNEKTVVLITTDESLHRLASAVKMPIAKSLQSKPQLPKMDDAEEFGDEPEKDDTIEAEAEAPKDDVVAAPVLAKKEPAKAPAKEEVIEAEPEPEAPVDPADKAAAKKAKNVEKMKKTKVPNFAKYRKFIIIGAVVAVLLIGFTVWATVFAPAAKIAVQVRTTTENFTEKVTFVKNEDKADPAKGIFYYEEKSVTKKAEAEFKATGEENRGEKAKGNVRITRPAHEHVDEGNMDFIISKGVIFTIGGKEFVVSQDTNIRVDDKKLTLCGLSACTLEAKSGTVPVVAKEIGTEYNLGENADIYSSAFGIPSNYTVTHTAMTGGTDKMVKVVTEEDIEAAKSELSSAGSDEARDELLQQFSSEYVLLGNMSEADPKIKTSPELNQEVGDNVTPKIVREVKYSMYAVSRDAVETFIRTKLEAKLGDDTQKIYDTGANSAFFEAFKNSDDDMSAKLKTTTKTGPRVTEEMVANKTLGKKVGEVQTMLKSINGVAEVKVDTSYFWVMNIPDDINKVQISITVEE